MKNKMSLFFIVFSGIAAFLIGGVNYAGIYVVNIALIYLSCLYVSSKNKNNELSVLIKSDSIK